MGTVISYVYQVFFTVFKALFRSCFSLAKGHHSETDPQGILDYIVDLQFYFQQNPGWWMIIRIQPEFATGNLQKHLGRSWRKARCLMYVYSLYMIHIGVFTMQRVHVYVLDLYIYIYIHTGPPFHGLPNDSEDAESGFSTINNMVMQENICPWHVPMEIVTLEEHAKDALKQQMMCSDIPICNCSVLLFFFPFEFCHVGLEFGPWTVPFRLYFGCVDFAAAGTLHCKLSLLSWVLEASVFFSYGFCVSNLGGSDHCIRNCVWDTAVLLFVGNLHGSRDSDSEIWFEWNKAIASFFHLVFLSCLWDGRSAQVLSKRGLQIFMLYCCASAVWLALCLVKKAFAYLQPAPCPRLRRRLCEKAGVRVCLYWGCFRVRLGGIACDGSVPAMASKHSWEKHRRAEASKGQLTGMKHLWSFILPISAVLFHPPRVFACAGWQCGGSFCADAVASAELGWSLLEIH